jgi:N-acyl-D-amino-acid deacylase
MGLPRAQAIDRLLPAGAIYFGLLEDDVQRILAFDETMIGSDGIPHDAIPHPRLWGTFPRVLGHYSRDLKLFPLETAVRKMTGLTARNFGLVDRGEIREGAFADLTLFDAATVADRADFRQSALPSAGIVAVFVNGEAVWSDQGPTGAHPGRVLGRPRPAAGVA